MLAFVNKYVVEAHQKGDIMRSIIIILAICIVFILTSTFARAEKRVALVIGNSNYTLISPLANPKNDAELMAETLEGLGFEVVSAIDVDRLAMGRAVRKFGKALRRAGKDAVGLLYYAGHGVQANNTNYLIPLGARIEDTADLDIEAMSASDILSQMKSAGNNLNMVVLDACRNNPFTGRARSAGRGLAKISAKGALIAFAAAPGQVALDGTGKNSPYTSALVKAMQQPGLAVEQVFKRVRINVENETGGNQTPWEESSLKGDFYFTPDASKILSARIRADYEQAKKIGTKSAWQNFLSQHSSREDNVYVQLVTIRLQKAQVSSTELDTTSKPEKSWPDNDRSSDLDAEMLLWNSVGQSNDVDLLQAYLAEYPNGKFAGVARVLIKKLSKPMAVAAKPSSDTQTAADREVTQESNEPNTEEPIVETVLVQDKDSIREIQETLYNLNYEPGPVDGVTGAKTRSAVRAFETDKGLDETGQLTTALLQKLRNAPVPEVWGVLGFAPATKTVVHKNRASSRRSVEALLRQTCPHCSSVQAFAGKECAALAYSNSGWGWAVRDGLEKARQHALRSCRQYGAGCKIKAALCAGG